MITGGTEAVVSRVVTSSLEAGRQEVDVSSIVCVVSWWVCYWREAKE